MHFQGEEVGDDLRYYDEDLQVGASELQWERADKEEPQADRFQSELNERQGELEDNKDGRRLEHLQVLSKLFLKSFICLMDRFF